MTTADSSPRRRPPPKAASGSTHDRHKTGDPPIDVRTSARRSRWWAPPADDVSQALAQQGMPPTLFGFVWRVSAKSQVRISVLAIAVFVLNTVPLELQRRILNATVIDGNGMMLQHAAGRFDRNDPARLDQRVDRLYHSFNG